MSLKIDKNVARLERFFKPYVGVLMEAADTIRNEGVSNYPIFVASQNVMELGIPLLSEKQMSDDWSLNASTLEEFHAKRVIDAERVDDFREVYRNHSGGVFIFAVTEGGANFLFIPE